MNYKIQVKKMSGLCTLLMAVTTYGATLSPITPTVDHSKKATCGIKWTFNAKQAIKQFNIYRSTSSDFGEADLIAEVSNTTDRLTDWGADQYQNYYYWVIPFDYNDESNVLDMELTRYVCQNHRYWGSSDVYLTASVKTLAVDSMLPLYFKVNLGTSSDPLYDHVKPDNVRISRMTDLNGNNANDIATIFTNRDTEYSLHEGDIEDNTYLRANGAFGYIKANKPGVVYLRAYYRSATTETPLRIEIKRPTFNLYAPEGEIDVIDNMYRDLYLKCNGKFVCPQQVEITMADPYNGPSVLIRTVKDIASTSDDETTIDLYENSFGFIEIFRSDDTCRYDIIYNDMLVKEYEVTPVWDSSRSLSFFYMDATGKTISQFYPNKEYYFGIKYGNTMLPHTINKYGAYWTTYDQGDWGFREYSGPLSKLGYVNYSEYGELGFFAADAAGWVKLSVWVIDRELTDSNIRINNN